MAYQTKWNKECKYTGCNKKGLGWSLKDGKWKLVEQDGSVHQCTGSPAPAPQGGSPNPGPNPDLSASVEEFLEAAGGGDGGADGPSKPMECKDAESVQGQLEKHRKQTKADVKRLGEAVDKASKDAQGAMSLAAQVQKDIGKALLDTRGQLTEYTKTEVGALLAMVEDIDKRNPRKVVVEVVAGDEVTETPMSDEHFHKDFPRLLALCANRVPALLIGKPGGSKSHSCAQVAKALKLEYREMVLGPTDTGGKVQGFVDAQGKVVGTEFRRAWEEGGVLMIEEIDNASPGILTTLNAAFANGFCTFPDRRVERHQDFILVACANTTLRGGDSMYAHRRPMDAATVDRFFRFNWEYDMALERTLALDINAQAEPWVDYVWAIRRYAEEQFPQLVVSPRATYVGAKLLKMGGWGLDVLLDGTVFLGGCDPDTRKAIMERVPAPLGLVELAGKPPKAKGGKGGKRGKTAYTTAEVVATDGGTTYAVDTESTVPF